MGDLELETLSGWGERGKNGLERESRLHVPFNWTTAPDDFEELGDSLEPEPTRVILVARMRNFVLFFQMVDVLVLQHEGTTLAYAFIQMPSKGGSTTTTGKLLMECM
uniref:Uncharacterized protein n=1 Tax=Peronospora matthiolae TaxID=2874970 RepID=A0AAV1U7F2_9STRA